jgi:hypothetical protein
MHASRSTQSNVSQKETKKSPKEAIASFSMKRKQLIASFGIASFGIASFDFGDFGAPSITKNKQTKNKQKQRSALSDLSQKGLLATFYASRLLIPIFFQRALVRRISRLV